MEGLEQSRWEARIGKIRAARTDVTVGVISGITAQTFATDGRLQIMLYNAGAASIQELASAWRDIFQEFWRSLDFSNQSADLIQDRERDIIGKFFDAEERLIDQEVTAALESKKYSTPPQFLKNVRDSLVLSMIEAKPECQALVNRLAAETKSRRSREKAEDESRWRQVIFSVLITSLLSAMGGGGIAILSSHLAQKTVDQELKSVNDLVRATQDQVKAAQGQASGSQKQADALAAIANKLSQQVTVLEKVSLPFAVVDIDGNIKYQEERFKKYGLTVSIQHESPPGVPPEYGWIYTYRFSRSPNVALFFSQTGAVPLKKIVSPNEFQIQWVGLGYGNPTVRSESVVQILETTDMAITNSER